MRHPQINLKKIFRKWKRKILLRFKGYCHVHGHNWRMKKGWQNNPDWDPEKANASGNCFAGMTKPWVYYECKRCGAHGEKA